MPSTGEYLKAAQARHRRQNFLRMMEFLRENPCSDCGESDPVVLDFDHLPEHEKKFEIGRAVGASTRSWASISREIAKCEVVCANCHRRRTAARAGHRRLLLASTEPIDDSPRSPPRRRPLEHGGGVKGRRGCSCDACRRTRNEYARSVRARARERDRQDGHMTVTGDASTTKLDSLEVDPQ